MPPNGFNPFDLVEDLKKSGFQQKQAESLVKILADVEIQNAATKQDLEATKLELQRDIKGLDVKIENIKSELQRDIKGLDVKIENIKSELQRDIAMLKKDMVIYMGGYAIFILGSLVTLAKLGLLSPS